MPVRGLILNVRGVDGDLTSLLFGGPVNVFVRHGLSPSLVGQDLGDGLGQSGLAVINVANSTDIDVWLGTIVGVGCEGTSRQAKVEPRVGTGPEGRAGRCGRSTCLRTPRKKIDRPISVVSATCIK